MEKMDFISYGKINVMSYNLFPSFPPKFSGTTETDADRRLYTHWVASQERNIMHEKLQIFLVGSTMSTLWL